MKRSAIANVWYLLILVILAGVFIFVGIKYLDKGDRANNSTSNDSSPAATSTSGSSDKISSPATPDQQDFNHGVDSLNNNNYQQAIDYFAKAISENPEVIGYYSLKSQAEVLAGKPDEAKKTLEAGLKVDPENELLNSKLDVLNNADNLAPAGQDTPKQ